MVFLMPNSSLGLFFFLISSDSCLPISVCGSKLTRCRQLAVIRSPVWLTTSDSSICLGYSFYFPARSCVLFVLGLEISGVIGLFNLIDCFFGASTLPTSWFTDAVLCKLLCPLVNDLVALLSTLFIPELSERRWLFLFAFILNSNSFLFLQE